MRRLSQELRYRNESGMNLLSVCLLTVFVLLTSCDKKAEPDVAVKETQTGLASFYGRRFQGQETASGETFNKNELVAAHPTYPLGTKVRVTNLENAQTVEVRIIDRGPTEANQAEGVIIDLSEGAAAKLQILKDGRAKVRLEVIEWGNDVRKG